MMSAFPAGSGGNDRERRGAKPLSEAVPRDCLRKASLRNLGRGGVGGIDRDDGDAGETVECDHQWRGGAGTEWHHENDEAGEERHEETPGNRRDGKHLRELIPIGLWKSSLQPRKDPKGEHRPRKSLKSRKRSRDVPILTTEHTEHTE